MPQRSGEQPVAVLQECGGAGPDALRLEPQTESRAELTNVIG